MKIQEWIRIMQSCKKSNDYTGGLDLKIRVNLEHTYFKLSVKPKIEIDKCPYCHTDLKKTEVNPLIIEFYKEQEHLSIFQAELLYNMFKINKIPIDYAKYHTCPAGKEFIANIKELKGGIE